MATKDDSDVRLSDALSEGEEKGTRERREKVFMCLQSLGIHCPQDNVPKIAVLGSGGGLRAMIAMLGTLGELKKQNLLDAAMYLCGVSGSTWCMSLLYEDKNWSEKLVSLEKELVETIIKSHWDSRRATDYAVEASRDDLYSLTDFWAAFLVYKVLKQINEKELADHREASETGINPYPIYAAVDKKKMGEEKGNYPGTWFEFTPHEFGYTALGAFESAKYLGSEFEKGKLKKRGRKKTICYMQALWGSALGSMAENIKYIKDILRNLFPFLLRPSSSASEIDPEASNISEVILLVLDLEMCAVSGSDPKEVFDKMLALLADDKEKSASYKLCIEMRNTWARKTMEERLESCAELCNELENEMLLSHRLNSIQDLLRMVYKTVKCVATWKWGTMNNFLYNCPNIKPDYLGKNKIMSLIDAGLVINSAYPLVLRAERRADLIMSFDFSAGDPFETIKKAAAYCQKNGIPFPKIDDQELDEKNPSDCYVFRGNKSCPTVMHFPLFNKVNCPGKIEDYRKKFTTFSTSYPEEDIKDLLIKARLNVSNNMKEILTEINQRLLLLHPKKPECESFSSGTRECF